MKSKAFGLPLAGHAVCLVATEVRILKWLIEKQVTTPEYDSLTLNALRWNSIRRTITIASLR